MIKNLYIKNFILIDELKVSFEQGLNVLTGETGSGKSIIIGAIDLALGSRANKDTIKTGTNKAYIELNIELKEKFPIKVLEENSIELEDNSLIISREITPTSTKSRINGVLVSQSYIQNLRKYLLDIHTQNESYNYVNPSMHIELLDNYGQQLYGSLLSEYRELYSNLKKAKQELEIIQKKAQENAQKLDFLKFQIEEIQNANIEDINEYDELLNERSVLLNAEELKKLTFSGYSTLYGEDQSIIDVLGKIESKLIKAAEFDEKLSELADTIASSTINLKESATELRNYSENLEVDPQKLNEVESRIDILDKMKKKYGPELSDVLNNLKKFESELNDVNFSDEKITALIQQVKELKQKSNDLACELSEERKKLAEKLSKQIQNELIKLEMPKAQFCISVEKLEELTNNGYDKVEFLIAPNTGEPLKPLAKIASGGEVSRIMLSIKSIFARADRVNTVIFDEIDTGISGKASQAVAEAFAGLSSSHQIICITHQAIIAAMADRHIQIKKTQDLLLTKVFTEILDENSRLNAIAGMASGMSNDRDAINFAKKLLDQAQNSKSSLIKA